MKLSLFTCFILFFTFPAFAQIPAGTRLREKSGLFDHHQTYFKTAALTYSHISFSAYQGRAVRENRFRGWYLSSTLDISLASGTGWEPLVSAGYFNRRYLKVTKGIYLFGEGQAGLATKMLFVSGYGRNPIYSLYGLSGSLSAGTTYFWRKNWGLTARCSLAGFFLIHAPDVLNKEEASLLFLNGHTVLNAGLDASRFELSVSHLIGSNDEKAALFSPEKTGAYTAGQRYIGGEIGFKALLGGSFSGPNLAYSSLRFRSPLTARGFVISGYYARDQPSDSKRYRWGGGCSFVQENYLPLLPKLSLLGRTDLALSYSGEEQPAQGIRQTHTLAISPSFSPAIQYQISEKWAMAGFVGKLTIGQVYIGRVSSPVVTGPDDDSFRTGMDFSPSFLLSNSGISFRYFTRERK